MVDTRRSRYAASRTRRVASVIDVRFWRRSPAHALVEDGLLMNSSTAAFERSGGALSPLGQRMRVLLNSGRATGDLRRYFGIDMPPDGMPFTGSRFEHLVSGETGRTSPTPSPPRT